MLLTAGYASAELPCGDVNKSGSVTASDALAVLKKAVGQAVDLLCAPPAQLLKSGQTTSRGPGSDGAVQAGIARSFKDNGDGTITDDATGLMWEKQDDSGGIHDKDNVYTWSTGTHSMDGTIATTFLAALNGGSGFAGHTDWRVPNVFELESLRNFGSLVPSTHPAFNTGCVPACTVMTCSCTSPDNYWSSSTSQDYVSNAWDVDFNGGYTYAAFKTISYGGRAVRGGL